MRVAVVGPCGSGKSTIVAALRERGYDAYAVSQEHSIVRDLWRHQDPDALVFLDSDFETIERRRGAGRARWLYELQQERLRDARANALLIVDTGALSIRDTVDSIVAAIRGHDRRRSDTGMAGADC